MNRNQRVMGGRFGAASTETSLVVAGVAVALLSVTALFGRTIVTAFSGSTEALDGRVAPGNRAPGSSDLGVSSEPPQQGGGGPGSSGARSPSPDEAEGRIIDPNLRLPDAPKKKRDLERSGSARSSRFNPRFPPLRTADELVDPRTGFATLDGEDPGADGTLLGGLLADGTGARPPRTDDDFADPAPASGDDPRFIPIEDLRRRARETEKKLAREEDRLAGRAAQNQALRNALDATGAINPDDPVFTRAELDEEARLLDAQARSAPENELEGILASQRALEKLRARAKGKPGVTRQDVDDVIAGNREFFREKLPAFRALERERDALLEALEDRDLSGFSEAALADRKRQLGEELAALEKQPGREGAAAVVRQDLLDTEAELRARGALQDDADAVEARAQKEVEESILPDLSKFRAGLAAAAAEEEAAVIRDLAGREQLRDENGDINPRAFAEDSLFGRISRLPPGPARARAAREFLAAARDFQRTVPPSLGATDERIAGGLVRDLREKSAGLLADNAPEILRQAAKDDPNAEKLTRDLQILSDPGTNFTRGVEESLRGRINKDVARAVASTAADLVQKVDAVKGTDPKSDDGSRARAEARDAANRLGTLLGALEASQKRSGVEQAAIKQAEEDAAKAIIDAGLGALTAPIPGAKDALKGAGTFAEKIVAPVVGSLQSTAQRKLNEEIRKGAIRVGDDGGAAAFKRQLDEKLRADNRRLRDLARNLAEPIKEEDPDFGGALGDTVDFRRSTVATDSLNQPGS